MRYAAKIDANQNKIVDALRDRGISVCLNHDDILVGYQSQTYWFEIKDPAKLFKADGIRFRKGVILDTQASLQATWNGHYSIVWELGMILQQIGYRGDNDAGQ